MCVASSRCACLSNVDVFKPQAHAVDAWSVCINKDRGFQNWTLLDRTGFRPFLGSGRPNYFRRFASVFELNLEVLLNCISLENLSDDLILK